MSLAMLASRYRTGEFAKWWDYSHLRPCVPASPHKDSHAVRLKVLSAGVEPHAHVYAAPHDRPSLHHDWSPSGSSMICMWERENQRERLIWSGIHSAPTGVRSTEPFISCPGWSLGGLPSGLWWHCVCPRLGPHCCSQLSYLQSCQGHQR